jgi:hypothetical protein
MTLAGVKITIFGNSPEMILDPEKLHIGVF